MFAFALWDEAARELHLARDRFGIKPLYLADDGTTIRVASQAKALLASARVSATTDDAALAAFLILGSIPEPRTAWSAISSVPAGATVTVSSDGARTESRYFRLPSAIAAAESSADAGTDAAVVAAFRASVEAHMVADVEVGVFLSAGVDSTSILGLASNGEHRLRAFTLGFDEFESSANDEVPLATLAAQQYGADHEVVRVAKSDFASWLPAMLTDMDQPTIDGVNTWMVARAAAVSGMKVALSGTGGDEILAGYPSFVQVPKLVTRLSKLASLPYVGRGARTMLTPLVGRRLPKAPGILEYSDSLAHAWLLRRAVFMPYEVASILGAERTRTALSDLDLEGVIDSAIQGGPKGAVAAVAALEAGCYLRNQLLRDADWAGMAHSLEIRVPLVDSEVFDAVSPSLTQRWTPPEGKQALADSPSPPLPQAIRNRPKTGFSVPMATWAVSNPGYDSWRRVDSLAHPRCSWARRWAYVVAERFGML